MIKKNTGSTLPDRPHRQSSLQFFSFADLRIPSGRYCNSCDRVVCIHFWHRDNPALEVMDNILGIAKCQSIARGSVSCCSTSAA